MAETAKKIAALEQKLFGDDPLKQRGIGSPYESADAKDKALHDALHELHRAEHAVVDAEKALAAATQAVADAQKAVDAIAAPPQQAAPEAVKSRKNSRKRAAA
jgi:exonuclease VII small subunit